MITMSSKSFDIVILGHVALDVIITDNGIVYNSLGGAPTYAGFISKVFNCNVVLISKVGYDFEDRFVNRFLRASIVVDYLKVARKPTTRFLIRYFDDNRLLKLLSRCECIFPEDLPLDLKVKSIFISPICREIPLTTLEAILNHYGDVPFLALDIQGFVRDFTSNGHVTLTEWPFNMNLLKLFHVVKSSYGELASAFNVSSVYEGIKLLRKMGVKIIIVTLGRGGSLLCFSSKLWHIPSYPAKVVDPTGCGDAFMGGFIANYLGSGDPLEAASYGSSAASFVAESLGSSNFGFRSEIEERVDWIMDNIRFVQSFD